MSVTSEERSRRVGMSCSYPRRRGRLGSPVWFGAGVCGERPSHPFGDESGEAGVFVGVGLGSGPFDVVEPGGYAG